MSLLGGDGSQARRWNLLACAPEKLALAQGIARCKGAVPLAVVVRPLRVEMVPAAQETPEPPPVTACGGRSLPRRLAQRLRRAGQPWAVQAIDTKTGAASSWSGLSDFARKLPVTIDLTASPNDPFRSLPYIEEITLRGPMTAQRRQWIQQAVTAAGPQGRRFDLTIVEIMKDGSDGKVYNYAKCFLTRYVYPVLSADGTGNLYEEVSIKPERLEMR